MNSEILSILFVAIAVALVLAGVSGILRRSTYRYPLLTGAAVGLATGPMIAFWFAKDLGMVTLFGFLGSWCAYTLFWMASCGLFVHYRGGVSSAT